jgi:hypothetical protein
MAGYLPGLPRLTIPTLLRILLDHIVEHLIDPLKLRVASTLHQVPGAGAMLFASEDFATGKHPIQELS